MKSQSHRFPLIATIHQLTAKTAIGNRNLQPEVEINEYSSSKKITRVLAAALFAPVCAPKLVSK